MSKERKSKSLLEIPRVIEEIKESEVEKVKEISPFDLLKMIFQASDDDWSKLTKSEKSRNFFICNRILSRGFPVQAQLLNWNGISTDLAIDLWRSKLKGRSSPRWIWQKSVSEKQKVEKKKSVNEDTLLLISKYHKCAIKDLLYFQDLYPDDFDEEVKKFT